MSSSDTCSTAEAAARLGVSAPTVINWARDGTLKAHQGQFGRKAWRIDVGSVRKVLKARGGRGARRGRPPGSVSAVTNELAALSRRVQSLEQTVGGLDATNAAVLEGLVRLLRTDGNERRAQSEEIIRTATELQGLLAAGAARTGARRRQPR